MHPQHHTRLPRYARGHVGEVVRIVGCHVFPDSNASNLGEDPHWLYTVRFDGRELWGADSDPTRARLHRGLGALSGAAMIDQAAAAPRHRGSAEHPARRRRTGVPRAVGGAGLRHDAGAARTRVVHLDANGRRRSPPRSSARRPPAIPTPARLIIQHWLAALEKLVAEKGVDDGSRRCIAIATPGTTPATAPRTASRSNCGRTISNNFLAAIDVYMPKNRFPTSSGIMH